MHTVSQKNCTALFLYYMVRWRAALLKLKLVLQFRFFLNVK